jgi:2-haloacid dehalogenase
MKYDLILFDIDDTLFDFQTSERHSFESVFRAHGHELRIDELLRSYKVISEELWRRLERGEVSKENLKVMRFAQLAALHQLEYNAEIVAQAYLDSLSVSHHLVEGALEICQALSQQTRLGIVTNGIQAVQSSRLALSPIGRYFDFTVVSEECGYSKPDARIFHAALDRAKISSASRVLMVGDRLEADVLGAKNANIDSCWFNPHSLASRDDIRPDFEIRTLSDLRAFL